MRGKPVHRDISLPTYRNIPAYAGKTMLALAKGGMDVEHPRVCGENPLHGGHCLSHFGTSPRMRGKLFSLDKGKTANRNIPAYAGKTCGHPGPGTPGAEHPRVCGENSTRVKA